MGIAAAVLLVAIAWSLYLAREITKPINEIAPDDPEDTYPELQPLVDKLRQQNRERVQRALFILSALC